MAPPSPSVEDQHEFKHTPLHLSSVDFPTCLGGAGGPALGTVQEVLPQQVLCLRLVSCALRVLSSQAGTSGATAGAGLGDVLTDNRQPSPLRPRTTCCFSVCLPPPCSVSCSDACSCGYAACSHCSFSQLPCGGRCKKLRGPPHWTPRQTLAPARQQYGVQQERVS